MNDWDSIKKIVNTLPQWDIIKLIMGIQEELKCAKEDNLYQLRQNKILQNQIDKAIEYIKIYRSYEKIDGKDYLKNREEIGSLSLLQVDDLLDILKESGE